jgi:ribose 5-phosphate isomerase B
VKLALGSDHAGFFLKSHLAGFLRADGHEIIDVGTDSDASVDYPDFAAAVGRLVASGEVERGVLVCGSGNGVAIAANKVRGVRAAVAHDVTSAHLAVEHNDANICCFGARFTGEQTVEESVRAYLAAEFAGGRHQRRIDKIVKLEEEYQR